jgi:hypothetical protein
MLVQGPLALPPPQGRSRWPGPAAPSCSASLQPVQPNKKHNDQVSDLKYQNIIINMKLQHL